MRKILCLGLLLWLAVACSKDKENNGIQVLPFIQENYSYDAKQLYLREIISDSTHPGYHNPELNEDEIQDFLVLFQAVYNCPAPEADEVFEYSIHAQGVLSLNSITLKVDTTEPAVENLANSNFPTGNYDLDHILSEYRFDSVRESYSYPDFPWLNLYSSGEYNMLPIREQFMQIPFIEDADARLFCIGCTSEIILSRHQEEAEMTFIKGWEDCPSGCIHHRYWEFHIRNNKAEFIRSYED